MRRRNVTFAALFLLPALLIYSTFFVFPIILGFRVTFYKSVLGFLDQYVGWQNFALLFGAETFRDQFLNAIKNNFIFLAISLIGTNTLGLTFAFLFSTKKLRGASTFRNILFSPQIIPIITVGYISSLIFNPSLGTYDKIAGFLHFPDLFINALGKPKTALYTISIIEVLRLLGFPLTIYYVAINDIPTDIIAASRIDGANDFRILMHVVLAMISPILITTNVLMFIGSFIYFDLIYIMQGYLGGPAFSTDVLGVFFYRTTFGGHHGGGDPGIGAVISMCMLLILAVVAIVGLLVQRTLRRRLAL